MQTKPKIDVSNEQELSLLRRVADKDRDALTELFHTYHARLFKFVFRLTHSYTIADEMVNDIMLLVWQKANTFRGESKVSTWIFGIAYRQTMRRVTQKQIRIVTSLDLDQLPSDDGASLELENWIRHGLKALPAAQQITVELVFFLGLSYQEVAAVCDCSVNTVKTRMFHARKKLKTLLEPSVEPTSSEIEKFDD
ncbi:MAG: RNA polymerase sigma factor [Proteobacteria bacterium]|nr:RNA polymerase sigma factor [Pseudomonadota bacterium]MDA0993077.1 RNA polymerase sigma factor [Pseudomonadota bacterium]